MAKIVFVKVARPPLEEAVCHAVKLLTESGEKVIVVTSGMEQAHALDKLLWTFSQEAFITHRLISEEEGGVEKGIPEQVVLSLHPVNWNEAKAIVLSGPAPIEFCIGFDLVVDFAPTFSEGLLVSARQRFKAWRTAGFDPEFYEGVNWLARKRS